MPKILRNEIEYTQAPAHIGELQDVDITSPSAGQVLAYNNGAWVNSNVVRYKTVELSFTSTNDGTYLIPTNKIALNEYPIFAYEETELQNYYFVINNYRNTNWLMWTRVASTWALETNKSFVVKVIVLY